MHDNKHLNENYLVRLIEMIEYTLYIEIGLVIIKFTDIYWYSLHTTLSIIMFKLS